MTPLTDAVRRKIDAVFLPESRGAVRQLLEEQCGTDLALMSDRGEEPAAFGRVRFVVLKLSGGDLRVLERELVGAHYDWRDTLMAAGFGQDIHAHLKWNPEPGRRE